MPGPKSVLVAEPDPIQRLGYSGLLEDLGYQPLPVGTGEDAVALFAETRPDLVLLNFQMRGFGGREILSVLKATDAADIPVIALAKSPWDRGAGGRAGLVEFLRTPCSDDEMTDLVERLIGPARISDMPRCALCGDPIGVSRLQFGHGATGRQVRLEISLCEACGDRVEKHLKRMIPKRLMQITHVMR